MKGFFKKIFSSYGNEEAKKIGDNLSDLFEISLKELEVKTDERLVNKN